MKKKGWLLDAGIGLALSAGVAVSYLGAFPLLESVEFKIYDLRAQLRQDLKEPPEILLVTIDDASISQIGRWPWPRARMAEIVEKIRAAGPKVIGLNVLLSEAEQNQGLAELRRLETVYKDLVAGKKIAQKGVDFAAEFSSAAVALDSDARLEGALEAQADVVLPVFFLPGTVGGRVDPAPDAVSSSSVKAEGARFFPEEAKLIYPVLPFSEAAKALGHVNLYPETDGVVRREAPLVKYGDRLYPSYALRLTMAYLGLSSEDLKLDDAGLSLGSLRVPLDEQGMMSLTFNGPSLAAITNVSFRDVVTDKVDPAAFKDKIVLVGPTATGVATNFNTPVAPGVSSVEIVATGVENVLHQRFLTRPDWAMNAELGMIGLVALFLMLVLPRMKAFWGLVASLVLCLALLGAGTYLFINGQWLKVGYPTVLLLAGYLVIISKGFLVTEKGKELVEASAIETNKMLGLSFQGQGMLDMAFEKFRLCPLDDNMKDTLYNLALDFERKRQYSKAAAVFDHIAAKDPKYKDIAEKTKLLKAAADGAVFGGVGGGKKEGTVMIAGGATKPTLGRYEIEKELGRGAMGVVYLGKDPKINRMVAIKTMMLEEGSDAAEAKAVKERFFREAESAGTLNHPNIVRIFDAGEENEVAYIAMELLDGHDLVKYCAKGALLPVEKVVDYIATVADALDYAHGQGIVHRDIKPANIMLLKDGTVRVADFGIARISASSKTATGTVMGTPSYMSPEQVAGKKVDGRADLFSLTVALFEMLTGEKPFKGGEGIGTLLFQIANDPHPDPLTVRADLPPALKSVIDRGLAKKAEDRFQKGSELAAALRAALKGGAPAPAPAPAQVPGPAVRTAEITAPTPAPAPAPAPIVEKTIPAPVPKPAPALDLPPPPAPAPKPAASEKTVSIGPEITIPGLNDLKPVAPKPATPPPAAAPAPSKPADDLGDTLKIERPQKGGVGDAPAPPPPGADPGATMRIEPTQSPDATLRIKPNPQEPI